MKAYLWLLFCLLVPALPVTGGLAETMDHYRIYPDGTARTKTAIKFPAWFKRSFFNLQEDLIDAREQGKRGLIVMLSQETCNTCLAFLQTTLREPVIQQRVRAHYDVIGMDIFSDLEVIEPDGTPTSVKDFAERQSARLTPTILFFGTDDNLRLKIVGFYPPEKFGQVLDYVEGHHYSRVSLRDYLRDKRIPSTATRKSIIRDAALFAEPIRNLNAIRQQDKRPLLIVFERPDCNPCQRFHQRTLAFAQVRERFPAFRAVQLDATDEHTRIVVPDGRQLTAKQWYDELQLSYDVAVVFLDEAGNEVLRLDAETGKYRMAFSMDYVLDKGYLQERQVLRWRRQQAIEQAGQSTANAHKRIGE